MHKTLLFAGAALLASGCQPPSTEGTDCKLVANTAMCATYPPGSESSCPRSKALGGSHEWEVAMDLKDKLGVVHYSDYYEACRQIEGETL